MSGLSTILNTDNYEKITYRPTPFRPYRINVGERGGKYGISGLRDARLKPIDVLYRETRVSNTPRLGEQLPSLPDRRINPQQGEGDMEDMSGGPNSLVGGGSAGEWGFTNRVIPKEVLDKVPELKGKKPKKPDDNKVEETKKILKVWMKIYDQMSPEEKKVVASQHKGIKRVFKMMKHMPEEALMKLRNSKTIKWLEQKEKEMKGGAHCSCGKGCMCGGSLWGDIKKGVKSVGKKVVSTGKTIVKGVKKGVKKTGQFLEKAGEAIEKGAEKTAEVAGKVAKVVSTAAEVATLVTAVIPGLEEFSPLLATVAAAAEGVEKLGKEVAKHSKTAKDVGKKMSGGKLPLPTRTGVTPGPRSTDRLSFVATHPMNYRKAIL